MLVLSGCWRKGMKMRKFLRIALGIWRRLNKVAWFCMTKLSVYVNGGTVVIGSNVFFVVPLRMDGQGKSLVGHFTRLGY